jgi:predicted nucleic acid-binding protein
MHRVDEPPGVEEFIKHRCDTLDIRGGDWSDAYLAASAMASGSRLVSFDSGIGRFQGLSWLHFQP